MQNIHPLLVHFPIALLPVGLVLDLLGTYLKRDSLRQAGWFCLLIGIAGAFGGAVSGIVSEGVVGHNELSHNVMSVHKNTTLISLGIFLLMFIWRTKSGKAIGKAAWKLSVYGIIGIIASGIMFYGGYQGGRLVYEFGVGTALQQNEGNAHNHDDHSHNDTNKAVTIPETKVKPDNNLTDSSVSHTHADGEVHNHKN